MSRRAVVEASLQSANEALKQRVKLLTEKKLDPKQQKRDADYRRIQAVIRKYKKRLGALDAVVALNADLETRRAERAAQPKVKKEKKKAPAPQVKSKKEKKPAKDAPA